MFSQNFRQAALLAYLISFLKVCCVSLYRSQSFGSLEFLALLNCLRTTCLSLLSSAFHQEFPLPLVFGFFSLQQAWYASIICSESFVAVFSSCLGSVRFSRDWCLVSG